MIKTDTKTLNHPALLKNLLSKQITCIPSQDSVMTGT